MEDETKSIIAKTINAIQKELFDISHYLWSNPETAYREVKAHETITKYLESKGFHVTRHDPTETAFLASFTAPSIAYSNSVKPVHVAVMCEYDALPSIGHACGHNLIAIVGLGAAIAIKEVLEKKVIAGKVTLIGCPAEEGGGGKVDHINAGNFDSVDFALMSHPNHVNISAPKYLARSKIKATFFGRSSHASDNPWEGKNALDAVVSAYQNVAYLRQQFFPGWQFHGVITKGGEAPNVIPDHTEMMAYLRSNKREELSYLHNRVSECFQAAALATNCRVEIVQSAHTYEDVVQNKVLESIFINYLEMFHTGEDCKFVSMDRAMGSTDMGNVSYVVPSLHPTYKIADGRIHTKEFAGAAATETAFEKSIVQAKVLAMMSLKLMIDKELLSKVKQEFSLLSQKKL